MEKKVVICGGGPSGLVAAAMLGQYLMSHDIVLIGDPPDLNKAPLGPWFPWATPEMGQYLGSLGLNAPIETRTVKYWDGGQQTYNHPPEGFPEWYRDITKQTTKGSVMTQGKNTFRAYDINWHGFMVLTLMHIRALLTIGRLQMENRFVQSLGHKNNLITNVDDIEIGPDDFVVAAFPLPQICRAANVTLASHLQYHPVAYCRLGLEQLPFSWPDGTSYLYTRGPNFPWYRVTWYKEGPIGESMDPATFTMAEAIIPTQTRGVYADLPFKNMYQVGRAARGDRSKTNDTIQQALTICRLEGKELHD